MFTLISNSEWESMSDEELAPPIRDEKSGRPIFACVLLFALAVRESTGERSLKAEAAANADAPQSKALHDIYSRIMANREVV